MIRFLNNGIFGLFEPCEDGMLDATNRNFFALDVFVQGKAINFVDALPLNPSTSDVYILTDDFTLGDVEFEENSVVAYNGLRWVDLGSREGLVFFIEAENDYYQFNGTDWVLFSTAISINPNVNLKWVGVAGSGAPIDQNDPNFGEVFNFSVENDLYASFKIDKNFVQIKEDQGKLQFAFSSQSTSGKVRFELTSTLVDLNEGVETVLNQHVDTFEVDLTVPANKPNIVTLDMTDAAGLINSVAFAPNKLVKLKLKRIDATTTEDGNVSKMIPSTTQVLI